MAGRVHATATLSRLDGSWSPEPETQIKPIPIPIPPQPLHATEATSARKRAPPQPQPSRPRLLASRCAFATRTSRYHRGGLYARDLPFIAGQEGGGTIAASTPKAEAAGFGVGKRVAYSVLGTRRMVTKWRPSWRGHSWPMLATNRPCLQEPRRARPNSPIGAAFDPTHRFKRCPSDPTQRNKRRHLLRVHGGADGQAHLGARCRAARRRHVPPRAGDIPPSPPSLHPSPTPLPHPPPSPRRHCPEAPLLCTTPIVW